MNYFTRAVLSSLLFNLGKNQVSPRFVLSGIYEIIGNNESDKKTPTDSWTLYGGCGYRFFDQSAAT